MTGRALKAVYREGAARTAVDLSLDGDRLTGRLERGGTDRAVDCRVERCADGALVLHRDGRDVKARVVRAQGRWLLAVEGRGFEVEREEAGVRAHAAAAQESFAVSPMTGLVAKVAVEPGQVVPAGAPLFVIEAMKMEYAVRAPRAVTVDEVRRKAGDKVSLGEVVVTFVAP